MIDDRDFRKSCDLEKINDKKLRLEMTLVTRIDLSNDVAGKHFLLLYKLLNKIIRSFPNNT